MLGRYGIHSTHRGVKLQSVFNCWHCQAAVHVVVGAGRGDSTGEDKAPEWSHSMWEP